MSAEQVAQGMAMPYGAIAVMGKGGAIAVLLMAFSKDFPESYLKI